MSTLTDTQLATLNSSFWFRSIPAALQDFLVIHGRLVQLDTGQRLFARDASADGLYAVLSGAIRISSLSREGEEAILAILEPAQWFGEIALFDGLSRTHDAMAEHAAVLLHIAAGPLHALLQEQPAYWRDFGRLLTQKMRVLFSIAEVVVLLPAPARLARVLVTLAEGYGQRALQAGQDVRVSQEQLGRMVSLTRQSVNQLLRQFEEDGAIRRSRGGFRVVDVQRLRRLSM